MWCRQSSSVDGKLDPAQPDAVVGPVGAAPELGPGGVAVADLDPEDLRKRMWWKKAFTNFRTTFAQEQAPAGGGMAFLATLPDNGSA